MNNLEIEQTKIDGTYLNAPLKETIYMQQLKGYKVLSKEKHVCQLKCTIYGFGKPDENGMSCYVKL